MSDQKQCGSGAKTCSGGATPPGNDEQELRDRLSRIKHTVLVLSGKGGVGKSTVAVNLAQSLADQGKRVGLLDIDIHGPSVPSLLNLVGSTVAGTEKSLYPVKLKDGLRVMSIGFLLRGQDDAVIWRGPLKYQVIKQFLKDVEWGDLDYLIVDSPPGTGDEPLSVAQLVGTPAGAVIVTTPQQLAITDVRKCITFCRQLKLPVLGVVENMSGFVCPHCRKEVDIFGSGGGRVMAQELGIPFLGQIPLDPRVVVSGDTGSPFISTYSGSVMAEVFQNVVESIITYCDSREKTEVRQTS